MGRFSLAYIASSNSSRKGAEDHSTDPNDGVGSVSDEKTDEGQADD
ncbi:hypothetical protein [Corynebacterium suicordis]|uniref:Uncharacterized protein n=1 Tax=Corynebacterium suicordis DSM 45110 TaxID=1121369 RepID=A0ABR9ZGS2_9CORY|nr:hypothetical protein [Corynebacterium suicordis]MBF4552610.1 hypothetical protein [Corynebacterium suicordis DSM 45110]MDR6278432.1 hypothetical protein [Corynebacterium suicordis]